MTASGTRSTLHAMPWSRIVFLSALAFGISAQLLFYRQLLGVNVPLAAALFLALAWRGRTRGPDHRDAWVPVFAIVLAAFVAVRVEAPLVLFDVMAAAALCLASAAALGTSLSDIPLTVLIRRALAVGVAPIVRSWQPIAHECRVLWPQLGVRRVAPSVAGLALAVPLVGIFALLFSSADAVFAHALRDALANVPDALRDAPGRAALAAIGAWVAAGTLAVAHDHEAPAAVDLPRPLHRETATALLAAVDVLFVLFVAIQVAYLFGDRSTLDAAGISYSEYARRGFFELVAASVVVGGLLFVVELLAERRTRAYMAAALGLVALTAVILASAAYRLALYQDAYGWSELRFYALAAIAFLGLALLILAWALATARMAFVAQPLVLAALVVAAAVNAVGPAAFITRADIARAADPTPLGYGDPASVDVVYLFSLGDASVPALVDALPELPERERACLNALLRRNVAHRDLAAPTSWQSYNLDHERAVDALRGYVATIPSSSRDDHVGDARLQRQMADALRACRDGS